MASLTTPSDDTHSAGDPLPPRCEVIRVHVGELSQLFNSIDPSPFRSKDLDPKAEEFIVGWAKEIPRDTPLGLVVDLDRPAGLPDEAAILRDAVHEFFRQRALATRRQLRQLFRIGRTSMLIGLAFLTMSIMVGNLVATRLGDGGFAEIIRESFLIVGWVAM